MEEASQGHWENMVADTHSYLGFIYHIYHKETLQAYLGRKQYFYIKQPRKKGCKTLCTDRSDSKWRSSCWKSSDWYTYTGSSKKFNEYIELEGKDAFQFDIIKQCYTKSQLHYAEVQALVDYGVLWKRNEDGDYIYFNRQIPATRFRVPNYEEILDA
jgi:hypothetical protein